MHCSQELTGRLNFQKNSGLSQEERLSFLFGDRNKSSTTLSSESTTTAELPWPQALSMTKRHANIEVLNNAEAHFVGPSDANSEAASVHSDVPIPNHDSYSGVYYFEATILSE